MRSKATARKHVGSYAPEIPPRIEPVAAEEEVEEDEDDAFANEDADSGSNRGSDGEDEIEEEDGEEDHVEVEENAGSVLASHFGSITNEESDESGDDCWKEDGIPDPISDEEEDEEGIPKSPESEDRNVGEEDLKIGKYYPSNIDFKKALLRYSLKSGYDIKLYISNAKKLGAVCSKKEAACPWRVYCSHEKRKKKLQIKVYEPHHTCIRSGYSKLLTSSTIAELFEDKLRHNPKFKPVEMADEIKNTYNLIVSVDQCRKAKTKLSKARRKVHEEQFAKIWDYEAELHKTNPGTTIDIETTPGAHPGSKQRFYRMYICFASQRTAWTTCCRPIIGLDGAFLKWDIKGQLIAAVGRDGDNRIVPIAWAVVEIENDTNWYWFLTHLKRDLGLLDGLNFTVISDKQKGLLNAVKNQLPQAEHRLCARHVLHNWKRGSGDMELQRHFWKIARSYTTGDYEDNLEALRAFNLAAYKTLLETKPETWSRAFFKVGSCCGDILNNLSESFNKTIREARRKPLLDLLEDVRRQCMVRTAKRSVIASKLKTEFTKNAHKQIDMAITGSKQCVRYMSSDDMHEIRQGDCAFRVELRARTCGCGKWQLNGIPCEHAACVMLTCKLPIGEYVSEYFTTKTWQQTYDYVIQPVQGMKLWPRVKRLPVLPPPDRTGKCGRPSTYARKKSAGETASKTKLSRSFRIMTCSNCKGEGHNKKGCKNERVEPNPKRPRGRPKKPQDPQSSQTDSQVGCSQDASQVGSQTASQASGSRWF